MKSIFEKSYMIKAQAEKAAAKEFGTDWAERYEIAARPDIVPARWAIKALEEAPKSDEEACNEILAHEEPKQHLTLADALAESGETLADLMDDGHKPQPKAPRICAPGERVPGYSHCPSCEIDLDNGVLTHGDIDSDKWDNAHIYECMACGAGFGPLLAELEAERIANASMGTAIGKPMRLSTAKKPTKLVWEIADTMPKAARKDVIQACIDAGVGAGTARTQYQAWFKASQECERGDIRKPYEKA